MPRRPLIALVAAAGLPLLAGCGSESPRPAAAAAERPATGALVVDLAASQFSPAMLDARVGQEITFVNRDGIAHTATAAAGAGFDSGAIEPGGRFAFTPRRASVIDLVCAFHPGMTGSITVS
jgi:plastocyanin